VVHDGAAAVQLPGAAPAAVAVILIGAIPGGEAAGPGDAAEAALGDGVADGAVGRVPPILEDAGDADFIFLRDLGHALDAIELDLHGFFGDDVFSGLHGHDGGVHVIAAGGADVEDVELLLAEHFGLVSEDGDALEVVFGEGFLGARRVDVADGDQGGVGELRADFYVPVAYEASAEDCATPVLGH